MQDDSRTMRTMLKSILEDINLNVIEAHDWKEALDKIEDIAIKEIKVILDKYLRNSEDKMV